jgi:hypothetical protein
VGHLDLPCRADGKTYRQVTQIGRAPRGFGPLAIVCGVLWAVSGWITTMDPSYWSPSATIDYAAVASFTAALIALAACTWDLRAIRSRLVTVGGAAAALGLFTAGVANILEDWFGVREFGTVFVTGVLVGAVALIPLGVGLARERGTRWMALGPLLSFPGLILVSQWWGAGILATTWIALGALHSLGRLR